VALWFTQPKESVSGLCFYDHLLNETKQKNKGTPNTASPVLVKTHRPTQVHAGPVPVFSDI